MLESSTEVTFEEGKKAMTIYAMYPVGVKVFDRGMGYLDSRPRYIVKQLCCEGCAHCKVPIEYTFRIKPEAAMVKLRELTRAGATATEY